MTEERLWLSNAMGLLHYSLDDYKPLTWASFYADLQPPIIDPPSVSAMLPHFSDKADSPAMICMPMDVLIRVNSYLYPGQIPVMACDCLYLPRQSYSVDMAS